MVGSYVGLYGILKILPKTLIFGFLFILFIFIFLWDKFFFLMKLFKGFFFGDGMTFYFLFYIIMLT